MTDSLFGFSPELDKLGPALVDFQSSVKDPHKSADNPFFKSKYVPLEAVLASVRPALNEAGISLTQWRVGKGLVTMLLHSSGQYIYGTAEMVIQKLDPQGLGSATTYERRYSASAACGIASDPDDDAEGAMVRGAAPPSNVTVSAPPEPKSSDAVSAASLKLGSATSLHELEAVWARVLASAKLTEEQKQGLESIKKNMEKRLK